MSSVLPTMERLGSMLFQGRTAKWIGYILLMMGICMVLAHTTLVFTVAASRFMRNLKLRLCRVLKMAARQVALELTVLASTRI